MNEHRSEAAFETVIELHLLASGYVPMDRDGFDRARAIFPETVLSFIRDTQPREWATGADERQLQVVAELVEVLTNGAATP